MYNKNANGKHSFVQYVALGTKAEKFIARYYILEGNDVQHVGTSKKTDLVLNNTTKVEVKHNYKKDDHLWLESVSVAGKTKGWMYTSTSDIVTFVSHDFSEIIITDFKSLQTAFVQLIKVLNDDQCYKHQPRLQPNVGYDSYCYRLPMAELEAYGASFTRIDTAAYKASVASRTATTAPATAPATTTVFTTTSTVAPAASLVVSTTSTPDQVKWDAWYSLLSDGFLGEAAVKALVRLSPRPKNNEPA